MKAYSSDVKLEGKQILVFSTEWCPDCIVLKMYIEQVVADNEQWDFVYVDSDLHPELASDYKILGIPSFIALQDGQQIGSLISKQSKPKELINKWIDSLE